jgi:hypothetical protein
MKPALDNAVITVEPREAATEERDLVIFFARTEGTSQRQNRWIM